MSGEGGLSASQVQSIVDSMLSPLRGELNRHASAINALEDEMGRVADAMNGMTRELAHRLDEINSGQHTMVQLQASTQEITRDQLQRANLQLGVIETTNIAGFVKLNSGIDGVSRDVNAVDSSVQQMSRAVVQMEVIRLLNEARGPVERVRGFTDEIDQRFAKAVENVFFVRGQYDQLISTAMGEYDSKLRTIGEHIFAVYEQDFRAWAEEPMARAPEAELDLGLSVDEKRIEARAEVLETNLDAVGTERLDPLLEANRSLEHQLAARFSTRLEPQTEFAVPLAARVYDNPTQPIEITSRLSPKIDATGLSLTPVAELSHFDESLQGKASELGKQAQSRRLSPSELASLRAALERLASAGAFNPELLQGYNDYLDAFGIEVIDTPRSR